ncbi:hypothetical protein QTP88_010263 [Uroleucon formosanum]
MLRYYRSIHVATNEISNTDDLSKITEKQILSAYTEGLPHDIKILLKASRPNKLSECVQIALEETSNLNQEEIRKNIIDYKNNRSDFKPSNSYGSKTNSVQKSNNRHPGACFRCRRTNHQAKQCRASEADQARYRESQNKNKTETKAIRIVTCNYCKKPSHTISECRKRKYVNERKAQEHRGTLSGNEQTSGPSGARPCMIDNVKLLIDTGSDLNIIKLSTLRNKVMVDETQSYQLKAINEYLVRTLETIVPIASTRPEGTASVVHSQILQDENVRLGNVVNTVKQGKILAIAINTSEKLITIPPLNIEKIEFEEFRETSMLIATNTLEGDWRISRYFSAGGKSITFYRCNTARDPPKGRSEIC